MREAGIGRVLVASLHQAIADILPTRLGFYENWLNAEGLRDGTIGLAPLYAVLSFLRQEGDAYRMITARAGEYTAEWTVQTMSSFQRSIFNAAPAWLADTAAAPRRPAARGTTAFRARTPRSRCDSARRASACGIQFSARCASASTTRLCGFYAAVYTRLFSLFNLPTTATVVACRATGEHQCALNIPLSAG